VPTVTVGTYTVTITDPNGNSATSSFTVATAGIALNATSGHVGDVLNMTGTGLPVGSITTGMVSFGGSTLTALSVSYIGTPSVSSSGTIVSVINNILQTGALFAIPSGVTQSTAGTYTVTFASSPVSVSTSFTVLPKLTVAPTAGVVRGATLTITGSGFAGSSGISATIAGSAITLLSGGVPVTTTGTFGSFTATYTLPVTQPTGVNALVVTDVSGDSGTSSVTVSVPTLTLSPATGGVGASVQVTGSGYLAATSTYIVTLRHRDDHKPNITHKQHRQHRGLLHSTKRIDRNTHRSAHRLKRKHSLSHIHCDNRRQRIIR